MKHDPFLLQMALKSICSTPNTANSIVKHIVTVLVY